MAELLLEQELEEEYEKQKELLTSVREALAADPTDDELSLVHDELRVALGAAEESLLSLKRERLLKEVNSLPNSVFESSSPHGPEASDEPAQENGRFNVGCRCWFRYTDGQWYIGKILELEDKSAARVAFSTPTDENAQICRFYLQQRCRFGSSCRSSHGILVQKRALKEYIPDRMSSVAIGSTVLACTSQDGHGLWKLAELDQWNEEYQTGQVVFIDDGRKAEVGPNTIVPSEHPQVDEESTESSQSEDAYDDDLEVPGLGMQDFSFKNFQTGQQLETVTFAKWEQHTRGTASKMMIKMGYREGTGLGISGQGIVTPLQVKVLPPKQSLDFISENASEGDKEEISMRRKSRGGKRKRDRKLAERAHALKAKEDKKPDVFSFINNQLAGEREAHNMNEPNRKGPDGTRQKSTEDRYSLVVQEDQIKEIRSRVGKLEEMAQRNRKDKVMYEAVCRKLEEARKSLTGAEATHASTSNAVHAKEQEKKWLRF